MINVLIVGKKLYAGADVMANWYLKRGDGESGPGTEDQIRAAFKKKTLHLDSHVRRDDSQA